MIDKIYYNGENESLIMNDKGKYFVVTKNSDNISFEELIVKMNKLEEISKKYIRSVNNYKLVKDHKSLKDLINTAIYASTALLCIANGLLLGDNDKSVGLFMICLNFVILKSALFFTYGTKYYMENEREELIKELNKIKDMYGITLDDVNKLIDSAQYTEIPATDEKINDIKNNCKKTYQLSK